MKVLITGAGGFIGRNLCENLKETYEVTASGSRELDLLDMSSVENYLKSHSFDVVIHTATNNKKRTSSAEYDYLDGNLRMFFNLERCRNYYGRMYYFGSGAEYDMEHYIPNMREEYFGTYIPKDPYGFSKYVMSKASSALNNIYDLRLFGVYGKYEAWERRFISNAICRALKGKDITIQKNVYFDYLWVEDLADIMRWFLEHEPKHKHYNVCRGERIDLYSLACIVRNTLGIHCKIVTAQPGWKPEYSGSSERLQKEMGAYTFTGFEESIRKLCDFYIENLDRVDEEKLI